MSEVFLREIFFYKHYFLEFYHAQNPVVRRKFDWTLQLIATIERVPAKYFDHISNSEGLYEIRVESGGDIFRVFCFFDKGRLIILLNGFQKKTQKTPQKEIERAEKLRKQYKEEQQEDANHKKGKQ
jgi:phage-related protein